MGTILVRRRANGTAAYMGKIILKHKGEVIHRESRTFDRRIAAKAWLTRREAEIQANGFAPATDDTTLSEAIARYTEESRRKIGRTKSQVLTSILRHRIAAMPCREIRSHHLIEFAQDLSLDRQPQTVGNYLSHLGAVFAIAGPAWNIPLDPAEMKSAHVVARRMGLIGKSVARDRRPTIEEMTALVAHFQRRAPQAAPMDRIILFALFSTRRQEEITRIRWADLEPGRVLVRDMKHPGEKIGNDVWCDLPPEAEAIARAMPRRDERIFPYSTDAISAAFTRATRYLAIEDLRFHDLRHEGITRLFETGLNIPHVAAVSGHRTWQALRRYTHIRQTGDRWAGFAK